MKKTYKKPEIIFEDFSLSTSIAAGCEKKSGFSMDVCAYYDPMLGFDVFISGVATCVMTPPDAAGDVYNGLCYHVPSESNNVFQS
jgi:hypothetical protein